jgi:hypothetical protein
LSPTNTAWGQPLAGLDAEMAALPLSPDVRGGVDLPGGPKGPVSPVPDQPQEDAPKLGPFLDLDPKAVFKALHQLVIRQEPLAKNRLAIDTYWTHVKRGHGLNFRLEKIPDKDQWKCAIVPGTATLSTSAVPNKLADLCSKVVETLMQDPPAPHPHAENDSEEAERAAEMAEEFLTQDGGEQGTRDHRLFWQALDAATSKSSQFLHYWVDQTGGGSVPLQIKAHPMAQDPAQPMLGPDGNPTADLVLRYVTAPQGGQFTTDPSQAAPQWLPKICVERLSREHVRTYPETADVSDAEMVILLRHCTLNEAKRRWPDTVGQMDDSALGSLCDWMPVRYMVLLPPAMRSRWKQTTGDQSDPKGSASDERTCFYYACYRRATPDYPKGCKLFLSGADGGTLLGKGTLSADVPRPDGAGNDPRLLDIPLVQIELVTDSDDQDPLGKPLCARVGGANEAAQILATGYLDALDKALHPAVYTPITSPVTGDDVANSRATGDHIPVLSAQDYPKYEEMPPLPGVEQMLEFQYEQMDSAMSTSKPAQGADSQQEVSGVARQIAVQQTNVAMSRMQQALASAFERHWRIKCQLAMAEFTVPQMIRYEGEDGAYKQEWWSGTDFAQVTTVSLKAGTGTMMPPQQKVQYVQQLVQMGFLSSDDAIDIAKPTFSETLGVTVDAAQQRIERQVGLWLKGPPSPEWIAEAQQYQQAKAVADQQTAQQQQQYEQTMQQHAAEANVAATTGVPHEATPPQPPQPVQPMDQMGQPMAPPWTPFAPLACDDEPMTAQTRQRRIKKLMEGVRFGAQPPEWQQVAVEEYTRMRQAVAAAQAPPAMPKGVNVQVKSDASSVGQAEQNATHPGQQKAA